MLEQAALEFPQIVAEPGRLPWLVTNGQNGISFTWNLKLNGWSRNDN